MKTVELGQNRHMFLFSEHVDCSAKLLAVHVTGQFWTASPDYDDAADFSTVYMWKCDKVTLYHPSTGVAVDYPVGVTQSGRMTVGGWAQEEDRIVAFETFADQSAGLAAEARDWFCAHFA